MNTKEKAKVLIFAASLKTGIKGERWKSLGDLWLNHGSNFSASFKEYLVKEINSEFSGLTHNYTLILKSKLDTDLFRESVFSLENH